jgi:hypothetical protein
VKTFRLRTYRSPDRGRTGYEALTSLPYATYSPERGRELAASAVRQHRVHHEAAARAGRFGIMMELHHQRPLQNRRRRRNTARALWFAIERAWLAMHESGTYVEFTQAGRSNLLEPALLPRSSRLGE